MSEIHVYMVVTADKYELPVLFAENINEMSRRLGRPKGSIYTAISRGQNTKLFGNTCKIISINLNDKEVKQNANDKL